MKELRFLKKNSQAKLVSVLVLVLVIVTVGYLWDRHSSGQKPAATSSNSGSGRLPNVDYSPGTAAEQQSADANKNAHVSQTVTTPAKSVTPIISYTSSGPPIQVSAYVPGIVESGGTCVLHASLGTQTVSPAPTTSAVINPSDTSCGTFSVARSKFASSGNWIITVEYKSSNYSGTSAPETIRVD